MRKTTLYRNSIFTLTLLFGMLILAACGQTDTDAELATSTHIGALRTNSGFNAATLPRNDDGSTGLVNIGFDVNYFGSTYSQLFVNNNGNVTFDAPLATFTPFNIITAGRVIMAPFFADIDTRGSGSNVVKYGTDTVNGRPAFGANWVDVGYFASRFDKLNSFQLVLIDRSDIGPGDFDIEFNYEKIQWETGEASSGSNGLGGSSARAGYSNGTTAAYEIAGSAVNGAFLDTNTSTGLIHNLLNTTQTGRYVFNVRNGVVVAPGNTPPTVDAAGPYSGVLGSAVSLSGASASDDDGDALTYAWSSTSASCNFSDPNALNPTVTCTDVGIHTLSLEVSDGTVTISDPATLHVTYDFNGFFNPINNLPTVNATKAGQAVPVKFSLNGYHGLNIFETGSPKVVQYNCESGALTDAIEQTVTAGGSSLSYDATTDQYVYTWKTQKSWSNTCQELQVSLTDGTMKAARFNLTR